MSIAGFRLPKARAVYRQSMINDVIHVSEAEAASDFASLMARVRSAAEIVVEDNARSVAVVRPADPIRGRSIAEAHAKENRLRTHSGPGIGCRPRRDYQKPQKSKYPHMGVILAAHRRGARQGECAQNPQESAGGARRNRLRTLCCDYRRTDARHLPRQEWCAPRAAPCFTEELKRNGGLPVTVEIAELVERIDGEQAARGISIAFEDLPIGANALHLG
jgi:hypothetical protein